MTQISPALKTSELRAIKTRRMSRYAVSAFFLMHGLCFATWASRIPTVQARLNLGVAELGMILLALPLGFLISLPFTGWLISKLGSRKATIVSAILYASALISIGFCVSAGQVGGCLFLFGFFANSLNLSMNTQAIEVEALYQRRLMSTFHGMWSLAGFAGAAIGAWAIGQSVSLLQHFIVIAATLLLSIAIFAQYLVPTVANKDEKRPFFALPEKAMLIFGAIAFCSAMIEGAMFDWSGIYFKDIVKAGDEYTGIGYTIFMIAMASARFCADWLAERFKLNRVLKASGILVTLGLLTAIIFPMLVPAALGFLLIGAGVSSVAPLVYSTAGKSKTMAAGTALTAVTSLGFVGFLIGPPMIGFTAGLTSLKGSFLTLTLMSTAVVILASYIRRDQ